MNKSEQINELATALVKAQLKIRNAEKNSVNPHFKNRYADHAAIIDACRSPLAENGLAVMQLLSRDTQDVIVETVMLHNSGQWISSELKITPRDQSAQSVGSAATYAKRYSLSAMLCIAADDDDDGNAATHSTKQQERERGSTFVGSPNLASEGAPHDTQKPTPSTALDRSTQSIAWSPSEKQLSRLFAITNASGYTSEDAKGLLKRQYGIESSKKMTKVIYDEFTKWLEENPKLNENMDAEPSEGDFQHG